MQSSLWLKDQVDAGFGRRLKFSAGVTESLSLYLGATGMAARRARRSKNSRLKSYKELDENSSF
jgi:hypothetical protein